MVGWFCVVWVALMCLIVLVVIIVCVVCYVVCSCVSPPARHSVRSVV